RQPLANPLSSPRRLLLSAPEERRGWVRWGLSAREMPRKQIPKATDRVSHPTSPRPLSPSGAERRSTGIPPIMPKEGALQKQSGGLGEAAAGCQEKLEPEGGADGDAGEVLADKGFVELVALRGDDAVAACTQCKVAAGVVVLISRDGID